MDYEKLYNEAIERAKSFQEKYGGDYAGYIFPELAESEDEKTLKEIKDFILYKAGHLLDEATEHRFVKYLEKQKEQKKPNIELIQKSWYMEGYNDSKFGNEPKWVIKTGEGGPKYVENPKYGQMLEEEQKPTENIPLSREEMLGQLLQNGSITMFDYLYLIDKREPAEWSEEDEEMRNECVIALSNWRDAIPNYGHEVAPCQRLIDWLKSLRPQPHWKPREDEVRLINTSISFLKDFADKGYENAMECIDWLKSKLNGNTCK